MTKSTLVIGLGGTGIKTLIHVKKQLQDQREKGDLPPYVEILGLDTMTSPDTIEGLGAWESAVARKSSRDYQGDVTINQATEFNYTGGNAYSWVCGNREMGERGWDRNHFARNWFDKRYFCEHSDARTLLNIDDGAGQYRQIGRLALFYNLRAGKGSQLYTELVRKLEKLDGDTVNIVVVGSLAGGTGAAMFIDIAHLVRKIAKAEVNKETEIYGMLALPSAFEHTKPIVVGDAMRGRAAAALRELSRFLGVHSGLGYHMDFIGEEGNELVLSSRTDNAVMKITYLFGERFTAHDQDSTPNPLDVRIEHGVCPSMATWILALIDEKSQDFFKMGLANRDYELGMLDHEGFVPSVIGSTGSYSVVLPLAAIIEDWTIRLALDALDAILPVLENGKIDYAIKGGYSGMDAYDDVIEYWKGSASFSARDVGDLGKKYEIEGDNTTLAHQVLSRTAEDWRAILYPAKRWEGDEVFEKLVDPQRNIFDDMAEDATYFYRDRGLLKDPLKDALVQEESPKNHNNSTKKAADELVRACDREEKQKLSRWKAHIVQSAATQVIAYREELLKITEQTLNGDSDTTIKEQKFGKLGWYYRFVELRRSHLLQMRRLLREVLEAKQKQLQPVIDSLDIGQGGGLLREMQVSENKQKDYLQAQQEVFDYHRWKLLCEQELTIVDEMYEYTDSLYSQLNSYIQMLRTGRQNVVDYLDSRKKFIIQTRKANKLEKVREIIEDPAWENNQYLQNTIPTETSPSAQDRVLADFQWEVKEVTDQSLEAPRNLPRIKLTIQGWEVDDLGDLDRNEITVVETPEEADVRPNVLRLMARTRKEFSKVWDDLTVVDYLEDIWSGSGTDKSPIAFAKKMRDRCDVLLRVNDKDAQRGYRLAYLIRPASRDVSPWIGKVMEILKQELKANEQFSGQLGSGDPTTITYLAVLDLLPIANLPAYKQGINSYRGWPRKGKGGQDISRELNHIYPAERNAVILDRQLPDGSLDTVSLRVVGLLEEERRLEKFVQAHALGIMKPAPVHNVIDNAIDGKTWKIIIPPRMYDQNGELVKGIVEYELGKPVVGYDQQGNPVFGKIEEDDYDQIIKKDYEWWLNNPQDFKNKDLTYITAAETFCLRLWDQSDEPQPLAEMHDRLNEYVKQKITSLLHKEYLPKWEKGEGIARGINAVRMPKGQARTTALWSAIRKTLYQQQANYFEKVLTDVKKKDNGEDKTIPDEINFIEILLEELKIWIKNESY